MVAGKVAELEVRYGGIRAVDGVSVSVEENQIVTVLGSNGAGKTSTVAAVMGLVQPSCGKISFAGKDITGWRSDRIAKQRIALVPEGRRIIAPLSVEENLKLGAFVRRGRREIGTELAAVYDLFPILFTRRALAGGLLSGGEQRVLAFGRALMADPRLILLDEPSMGLAPVMIDAVMEAVAAIARRGIAILMVEQNVGAALVDLAHYVYVLGQGRVVRHGTASEIRGDPDLIAAYLGATTA